MTLVTAAIAARTGQWSSSSLAVPAAAGGAAAGAGPSPSNGSTSCGPPSSSRAWDGRTAPPGTGAVARLGRAVDAILDRRATEDVDRQGEQQARERQLAASYEQQRQLQQAARAQARGVVQGTTTAVVGAGPGVVLVGGGPVTPS